jgi:hypothetical protein
MRLVAVLMSVAGCVSVEDQETDIPVLVHCSHPPASLRSGVPSLHDRTPR